MPDVALEAGRSPIDRSVTAPTSRLPLIIVSLGFVFSWLIPFFSYPYWAFYHDYLGLFTVVFASLVFFARFAGAKVTIPAPVWFFVSLAALISVHAVTGFMVAPWDAVLPIGYLLVAGAATVLGTNIVRIDRREGFEKALFALAAALLAAGLVSALITYLQYLNLDSALGGWTVAIDNDGVHGVRPFANLGQPNQLALILCWSIAGTWWLYRSARLTGLVAFVLTVCLMVSVVLTQSKIAWIILPALAALALWGNRLSSQRRVSWITLAALAALFIAFVLLLPHFAELTGTVTDSVDKRMESNRFRATMILQGFAIASEHPLLGVGWSNFGANQVLVAPRFAESQYAMHSHNLVANLAAETGWPITIAILGSSGLWFHRRFVKRRNDDRSIFVLMLFAAVGVHSMVEFPLWYAYVLLPIALVVGLVEGREADSRGVAIESGWMIAFGLVAALSMVTIAADYRRVVQAFRALGYERIGLTYADGSTQPPQWTAFPHFYDYITFANTRPTIGFTPEKVETAERVARRFAYTPVLMRLATIYALNGRPDDALRTMASLRSLYGPRYVEAYEAWAVMAKEYPEVLGKVFERLPPP